MFGALHAFRSPFESGCHVVRPRPRKEIVRLLAVVAVAGIAAAAAVGPALAATTVDAGLLVRVHGGDAARQAPPEAKSPSRHIAPYAEPYDDDAPGLALQLDPFGVRPGIRWRASTVSAPVAEPATTRSHVWVTVPSDPQPYFANRTVALAFVIGLFALATSGVALMWRQVGASTRPERPGWERWHS